MAYTTLRVVARGVVLYEAHRSRFTDGEARRAFERFCATAAEGCWSVRWDGGTGLQTIRLAGSSLREGLPVRLLPTPVPGSAQIEKPPPEGPYTAVRQAGVATLLTWHGELCEESVSSLLSWDGHRLLCVPRGRPRVRSTSEDALRELLTERPLPAIADEPLLLINAVKGTCGVVAPGRGPFPAELRGRLDAILEATARRP